MDHILIHTFEVTDISAIMFFDLVPMWLMDIEISQGKTYDSDMLGGQQLLTVCWLTTIRPWDQKKAWNRITEPADLFRYILQRNKAQLLRALGSPFATDHMANLLGRDRHGPATD